MTEATSTHTSFLFDELSATTANVTLFGIQKEVAFTKDLLLVGDQPDNMISVIKFNFQHNVDGEYNIDLQVTLKQSNAGDMEKFSATGIFIFIFADQLLTTIGEVAGEAVIFNPNINIDQVDFGAADMELTGQITFDDLTNTIKPVTMFGVEDLSELYLDIKLYLLTEAKSYLLPYALIPQKDIDELDRIIYVYENQGTFEVENIQTRTAFLTEIVPLQAETLIRRLKERKATTESKMRVLNWMKWMSFIKKGLITPVLAPPIIADTLFGIREDESKLIVEACKTLTRDPIEVLHLFEYK